MRMEVCREAMLQKKSSLAHQTKLRNKMQVPRRKMNLLKQLLCRWFKLHSNKLTINLKMKRNQKLKINNNKMITNLKSRKNQKFTIAQVNKLRTKQKQSKKHKKWPWLKSNPKVIKLKM